MVLDWGSGLDHSPPFSHHLYPHHGPFHFHILISTEQILSLKLRPENFLTQNITVKFALVTNINYAPRLSFRILTFLCDNLIGKICTASSLVQSSANSSHTKGAPFSVALSLAQPAIVTKCHGIQICKEFHPNHQTFTTFQHHPILSKKGI